MVIVLIMSKMLDCMNIMNIENVDRLGYPDLHTTNCQRVESDRCMSETMKQTGVKHQANSNVEQSKSK